MKLNFLKPAPTLILITLLIACAQQSTTHPPISGEDPTPLIEDPTAATPTMTSLLDSGGPFLLIQTGVDVYSLINFADRSITPFDPPGPNVEVNLAENLSPSGTQMLFPTRSNEISVYSFLTGEVHTTYHLEEKSSLFQPELAATAAREALPGMKYSDQALLTGVKNAFLQSISAIQWFQSDRYLLTVLPATATSTQLTLDDTQTESQTPLEELPALVEDFWVGPDGERILLKKGFMFEPGVWQDDRYYIIDVSEKLAVPIPLPEDADNPRVFWFGSETIGIIHQPELAGGRDFSLVDAASLTQKRIISGPFNDLHRLSEGILTVHHEPEADITTLSLRDLMGSVLDSRQVKGLCFFSAIPGEDRLLMNCGLESVLIEIHGQSLSANPFGKPFFLLSNSPDDQSYILVTQDSEIKRLAPSLKEIEPLLLKAPPLEIRWLPDSSGFLYRTPHSLYLFDLQSKKNTFIIESDLFGDYRNLNAVWVNTVIEH
jgi:hypothetical protein